MVLKEQLETATEVYSTLFDLAKSGQVDDAMLAKTQEYLDALPPDILTKAKLDSRERNSLPNEVFAYIAPNGARKLPVENATHARNALARFNQTEFDSSSSKAKAKRKILAACKRFGIPVSPTDKVAKSPGVPDDATFVPSTVARAKDGPPAQSGANTPETAGTAELHADPSRSEGGQSPYRIPVEGKVNTHKKPKSKINRKILRVVKKKEDERNWMAQPNEGVGSPSWQEFDSSTLDGVSKSLAHAIKVVEKMREREATEATQVDPKEWEDVSDIENARAYMVQALRLVAALVYREGEMAKSAQDRTQLLSAINAVAARYGDGGSIIKALAGQNASEGGIVTELTKEQLAALVAKASKKQIKKAALAERKRSDKLIKRAMKKAKKIKNPNNGGDITAEKMEGETGHAKADDLHAIPGSHASDKYLTKKDKKILKGNSALKSQLAEVQELVAKMAARPASGGPVLDGQPRGAFLATEGRNLGGQLEKGGDEISRLEALFANEKDPARRDHYGMQLTKERLMAGHLSGNIPMPRSGQ
jgi:hypothetical protein